MNDTSVLSPPELLRIIERLPADQPITDEYEGRSPVTGYANPGRVWYDSQKQHLMGFIGEYGGPGAYNRANYDGTARDWYQRFQCAPGLLWLAEALGEDPETLARGVEAIRAAGPRSASQCGAFRRVVPWSRIEELIAAGSRSGR